MPDKISDNIELDINSDKKILYMGLEVLERILGKERKEQFIQLIKNGDDTRLLEQDKSQESELLNLDEIHKILTKLCESLEEDSDCGEMVPDDIDKFLREYR